MEQGIKTFDTKRQTCIHCNWSKDGIGYVVLQQYCQCSTASTPTCCPNGWQLTFAGSRFTTPTEKQYSPTEGEALAVAWGLNNAKIFVLGCQDLIIITDHKPLLSIVNNRDLGTITNPQILKLKKTLQYSFTILSWQMAEDCRCYLKKSNPKHLNHQYPLP